VGSGARDGSKGVLVVSGVGVAGGEGVLLVVGAGVAGSEGAGAAVGEVVLAGGAVGAAEGGTDGVDVRVSGVTSGDAEAPPGETV
jgi:hypothetical protein